MERLEFLKNQGIREELQRGVEEFRRAYSGQQTEPDRVQKPEVLFFGREILEMAIAALLEGENLLLTGEKATGKNGAGGDPGGGSLNGRRTQFLFM